MIAGILSYLALFSFLGGNAVVWLEIMKELQEAFADVAPHVIVGALEPADYANDGVVFLIRDGESIQSLKSLHEDMQGTVNLLIENWVRDDTTDIYNGYGKLAEQEDKMIESLKSWLVNRNTDNFSILSCNVGEIISDGDAKRPLVGSRMSLDIIYSE